MSRDPDGFEAPQKMRRLPIYLGLGGVALLIVILIWSVNFSTTKKQVDAPKVQAVAKDSKPLIEGNVGPGLAVAPPVEPTPATPPQQPIVVVTSPESPELTRERDELRRRRHQAALSALSSPLIIRKGGKAAEEAKPTAASPPAAPLSPERERSRDNTSLAEQLAGQLPGRDGAYDPAADRDKENFFGRVAAKGDRQWQASGTRVAGQRFEVKTGSVIPATMIGGINSDLPGQIIAQVSRNVYDTADGRYLLIPQGAKLFGVYDSRIIYGQSRVLVAWNRIVFPDGSAITLDAMPGTDGAGYSGLNDEVDNHYFRIFSNALLMTLITGGTSWAVDSVTPGTATSLASNASPSMQQQMASSLATQLGQVAAQTLTKNINIKPTLEIRTGYSFNVVVTKDLVFGGPYHEQR